ncbi:MAG: hypothetical protein Q4C98_04215 [Capnocytophaga sp.]|nr:hypothetical protein [Capnocytophaga sp.]
MNKIILYLTILFIGNMYAQTFSFEGKTFQAVNATASVVKHKGKKALKVERDLQKIPFDVKRLEATVDEPTYLKLVGEDFTDGVIEVTMLSEIQNPSPFENAQGFIGIAYRISPNDTAFENIYVRPKAAESGNQLFRNHTVQYYAYPDFKFEKLRKPEYGGQYESYASVGLNRWIKFRIEVSGKTAKLYIDNNKEPIFIVNEMLGKTLSGGIALWVDIGTVGYFRNIKIIKK